MTREETQQILKVLKVNYPNSWNKLTDDETFLFLDLWAEAFKHEDAKNVITAVKAIIYSDKSDFAPSIGKVKHMVYKLTQPQFPTASEAWDLLDKAISNSLFGQSKQEFEKLPRPMQEVIGSADKLSSWAVIRDKSFYTTYKKDFMYEYNQKLNEAELEYCMPSEAKVLLGNESGRYIE